MFRYRKAVITFNVQMGLSFNPMYTGKPLMGTFINSEDSDEMSHNGAFHRVHTVCKGNKDLHTKKYNIFFN